MNAKPVTDVASAVADLKKKWKKMHPVDRGLAVNMLKQAGCSVRQLAKELNCSESLLRVLIQAAKAPVPDRIRARNGEISIRELTRRRERIVVEERKKQREAAENFIAEQAQKGCSAICDWLEQEQLAGSWGECIAEEARRILMAAELNNQIAAVKPLSVDLPLKTIIEKTRPLPGRHEEDESPAFFSDWLAQWAFYAMPDSNIREKALSLAIREQVRI